MSDDLVKRLRDMNGGWASDEALAAANRIEELIAERDEAWKRADHAEKMWGEAEVKLAEYKHVASAIDNQWALSQDEIADLKAQLAKALEALASWKHYDESGEVDHVSLMLNYADAIEKTRTTLAELTGGNKDDH